MKKLMSSLMILASSMAIANPIIIDAPVDHLFVPEGFDNNDNVEFVVTGAFPNPCYKRNKVTVDVVGDIIDVKVNAIASSDDQACPDMIVPFKEIISVGNLQSGDYKIVINKSSPYELKNEMNVVEASSQNVDDNLYAMIDYVDLGFVGGASGSAKLVGWVPSDCIQVDRVEYKSNGKDVLSILPIMKQVSDFCPMKMMPISIPVKFEPENFKNNNVLLYVRTLDGKSVNSVVNIRK
jgi:hypothetical protein